jgi:hypothetical protein
MKKAVYIFVAMLATAANGGAAEFIVGFDAGNFGHPFSGC